MVQVDLSLCEVFLAAISHICDSEMPFFWNTSSNLQSSLAFLHASLFLESLSLTYNEVHLYFKL